MDLLDKNDPLAAIQNSRDAFVRLRNENRIDDSIQFRYAIDLLRTKKEDALKLSVKLLEDLFGRTKDDGYRRDCLFYLAIAHTKLSDYENATNCCNNILEVQPQNHQVRELLSEIKSRAKKDGLTGLAVVGGAVLTAAALLGLGVGLGVRSARR